MAGKKYATADQRRILAMAGVEHTPGRSYNDAEALIDEAIRSGRLPGNVRDQASVRQRKALDKFGVEYPDDISSADASQIIEEHTPPTDKQMDFLRGLGAKIPPQLSRKSASDLIDHYTQIVPMSDGQAKHIEELGGAVIRSMTYKSASEFIEYLYDHELRCVKCGSTLDRRSERCPCGAFAPKLSPLRPPRHLLPPGTEASRDETSPDGKQFSLLARLGDWIRRR